MRSIFGRPGGNALCGVPPDRQPSDIDGTLIVAWIFVVGKRGAGPLSYFKNPRDSRQPRFFLFLVPATPGWLSPQLPHQPLLSNQPQPAFGAGLPTPPRKKFPKIFPKPPDLSPAFRPNFQSYLGTDVCSHAL